MKAYIKNEKEKCIEEVYIKHIYKDCNNKVFVGYHSKITNKTKDIDLDEIYSNETCTEKLRSVLKYYLLERFFTDTYTENKYVWQGSSYEYLSLSLNEFIYEDENSNCPIISKYNDKNNNIYLAKNCYATLNDLLFDHEIVTKYLDGTEKREGGYNKLISYSNQAIDIINSINDAFQKLKDLKVKVCFDNEKGSLCFVPDNIKEGFNYDDPISEHSNFIEIYTNKFMRINDNINYYYEDKYFYIDKNEIK